MSLDVRLYCECGSPCCEGELFSRNITHNLGQMASAAGIYEALWRPENLKINKASELVPLLETGLALLIKDPDRFKALNPENGWGSYDGLCDFASAYLEACKEYPKAKVSVSR